MELKRELGLRDITLFAISCIVGTRWIAAAAHAGPGAVSLWLLGAVFFLAPLAIAVATLSAKHPGAGGLYVWTRGDYGPWHGFLGFWVYWMGIAFWFPSAAIFYMSAAFYTLGPRYQALAGNRYYVLAAALVAIWIALGTNMIGVRIGKWTENIGAAATWLLCGAFVALAAVGWRHGGPAAPVLPAALGLGDGEFLVHHRLPPMSGIELAGFRERRDSRSAAHLAPRAGWIASEFMVSDFVPAPRLPCWCCFGRKKSAN